MSATAFAATTQEQEVEQKCADVGNAAASSPWFIGPTVFSNVTSDAEPAAEEVAEAEAEMFTAIQARAAGRALSFWFDQREDIYED